MNKKLINIFFITGIVWFTACTEVNQAPTPSTEYCLDAAIKEKITIDSVALKPVTETLALTGQVEYNPDRVIHFVSLVGGVITNTYFSLGEEVKKGQLLAEIKSIELSQLLAQKRTLQSQILVAEKELQSIKSLYDDQITSQKDWLAAQSHLDGLQAEFESIEAHLHLYSASSERGVFQIRASSSGTIVQKNITPGMQISADGEPLFTLADLREVWIMANVYAGNVPYITENMPVSIQALSYPNHVFKGKIDALSQVFDVEERVLKARIVMPNQDSKLMPGMLVDVFVAKELGTSAISIPLNALIFSNNQHFVLIYKNDCDLEIRPVTPFIYNTDQVYFQSNLEAGEQIITKNHLLIYNHLRELK